MVDNINFIYLLRYKILCTQDFITLFICLPLISSFFHFFIAPL